MDIETIRTAPMGEVMAFLRTLNAQREAALAERERIDDMLKAIEGETMPEAVAMRDAVNAKRAILQASMDEMEAALLEIRKRTIFNVTAPGAA